MEIITLKVKNKTGNRIIAHLLDVDYSMEQNTLFIPENKYEIDMTYENTDKKEFKQIGYWAFVQFLNSANIHATLLSQTSDTYPPRFIWYQRMDNTDKNQDAIRGHNLIMPAGEDAKHVIGQRFGIDSKTILKLYLYPEEQYYVQFEMILEEKNQVLDLFNVTVPKH